MAIRRCTDFVMVCRGSLVCAFSLCVTSSKGGLELRCLQKVLLATGDVRFYFQDWAFGCLELGGRV